VNLGIECFGCDPFIADLTLYNAGDLGDQSRGCAELSSWNDRAVGSGAIVSAADSTSATTPVFGANYRRLQDKRPRFVARISDVRSQVNVACSGRPLEKSRTRRPPAVLSSSIGIRGCGAVSLTLSSRCDRSRRKG